MKKLLFGVVAVAVPFMLASPAMAGCASCAIQTKVASTKTPGQFDYKITCIEDRSGDEITSTVTAANDADAEKAASEACGP